MPDAPDFAAATAAQQRTWSDGDFSMVATGLNFVAENLVEALAILPDERVLDVACGSGNGAIAAARRSWIGAVGCDFVPALLERGRERAAAERLEVEFVEADAQDLPFEDGSFDVAISIFGAMFAPDQERAAAELLRVVKPGGRIGMANWTPDGRLSRFFRVLGERAGGPPQPGPPPVAWGGEERLRELFGDAVSELRARERVNRQAFRSTRHYLDFYRAYFGPIRTAFERVGADRAGELEAALQDYLDEAGTGDGALVLEPEYLEIVAVRA